MSATRSRSSGRVFASLDELLADPAIDIVDIATGPEVRLELIARAVEAGKHVLAQKPLALDVAPRAQSSRRPSAAASGSP